ncbi:MAG: hypothetical protein RLZZ476_140 [Verrucomicrobiota bacterium]|jgi:hypothetical protein
MRTTFFIATLCLAVITARSADLQPPITVGQRVATCHANHPLQILSSYCHFAVIYRKSPVGLPLPLAFRTLKDISDDDKTKLNTLLQQSAWDTVSAHPMSGIMK